MFFLYWVFTWTPNTIDKLIYKKMYKINPVILNSGYQYSCTATIPMHINTENNEKSHKASKIKYT